MKNSVSYIITVYNKAPCLPELVSALLAQEGDFDREFIFVDDGSTDDSLAVLHNLCDSIPEAVIISQKNAGPSSANNAGIKRASKKWVFLLDGDDYLFPEATKCLLDLAQKHDSQICHGRHSNNPKKDRKLFDDSVIVYDDVLAEVVKFHPVGAGALINRDVILRAGGCDERVFIQDYSIALRIARCTSKMVVINALLTVNIDKAQQRLSSNKTQENYDTALARYLFIKDNLDIEYDYKYLAFERQLKKSWSWYRKQWFIPRVFSKYFLRYLISRFNFGYSDFIITTWMEESLEVYDRSYVRKCF